MKKYRIEADIETFWAGSCYIRSYTVLVKHHWWSSWKPCRHFVKPEYAIKFINEQYKH